MTWEGTASLGFGSITGSGFLAAFALILGANNLQIGILAALPFITQPLQIPCIFLVEKLKRRKLLAVSTWVVAQAVWIPIALIPVFIGVPSAGAVSVLLGLMALRSMLSAVTQVSWNGWVRDLVPRDILGTFFSRRLSFATIASIVFGLGAAFFVDYWRNQASPGNEVFGYTIALLFGAVFIGMTSPIFMALMPEPLMQTPNEPQSSLMKSLAMPFRDRNFRQLMNFLFFRAFTANLAIPFFAVYMLQRIGLPLSMVIAFTVLSQVFNVLFLRVWGPFSDRFGSKVVLSLSSSLFLLVIIGWAFTTMPERYFLTIPLLVVLHIFAGIATAGVSLSTGTIGMKLAPEGNATAYLAGASLATNLGAGLGPLVGGRFADFFSVRALSINIEWIDPSRTIDLPAVNLTGFDFLFVLAFVIGLVALNTLTTIREEGEVSREIVLEELLAQSQGVTRAVSSVPGLRFAAQFPYSYLRNVPGMDVAVGVTAYQLASSTRAATVAANRGRESAEGIARRVGDVVFDMIRPIGDVGEVGVEIARHATRGAMNAVDEVTVSAGDVAKGSVLGVLRSLGAGRSGVTDFLRGAVRGTVEGANESGADVAEATIQAVEAAREAASSMGISEDEATAQAAEGALEAASAIGPEAVNRVKEALARSEPERSGN